MSGRTEEKEGSLGGGAELFVSSAVWAPPQKVTDTNQPREAASPERARRQHRNAPRRPSSVNALGCWGADRAGSGTSHAPGQHARRPTRWW